MSNVKMCGMDEYRYELFEKFKTAALFAVLTAVTDMVDDPKDFRETLIKTWADKTTEEYMATCELVKGQISEMPENEVADLPLHLTPDGMADQESLFHSLIEEMSSDIRAMLNNPKEGGV